MAGYFPNMNGLREPTGFETTLVDADPAQAAALPEGGLLSAMAIAGLLPSVFKNAIVGGGFAVNPWQRGTSFSGITNTLTYTADRFFAVGGASSSISVSRQAVTLPVTGPHYACRVQRAAANADTAAINFGTALTSEMCRRFQGRQVVLSFYATAGANFSPAGGLLTTRIIAGKGTDQSAANMVAGSWTTQANLALYVAQPGTAPAGANAGGNPNTTLVAGPQFTAVSGIGLTTERVRYQLTATVPANVTQLGLLFSFTPVGTAGANDWFQLEAIQLEEVAPQQPYATTFQQRPDWLERLMCQQFFWRMDEKAAVAAVQGNGMMSATNVQTVSIPTPVRMRTSPTVTVSAGTFRFNIAGTLTAVGGGFAGGAAATQAVDRINVVGAVTATAGQATQLVSGAATWGGYVDASAEL